LSKDGRPVQSDEIPLQPQILIEPFEKWDLYFVGPSNLAEKKKKKKKKKKKNVYILVCTYYVTKWVESKALSKATEKGVAKFLYEDFF
jgi:hypothetical protein